MQIDQRYIENGIVEVVNGWGKLTKLGHACGFILLVNLTIVETNTPASLEVYQSVEVCKIPKHILVETPNSFRFTKKGINWIQGYIEKNSFNPLLFKQACELKEGCELV